MANTVTGEQFSATRGGGAWSDGARLRPAPTSRLDDAVVAVTGLPRVRCWRQFRALGSAALALCDVAAGRLDAFLDVLEDQHAPWDYLGGLLVCQEAGASVVDVHQRDLAVADPTARRQLLAAATAGLLDPLRTCAVA